MPTQHGFGPGSQEVKKRRSGTRAKKSRLSAPEITLDSVESAASTSVIILSAADVINGHSGDYEGALDQLGRFYLRSNKKVGYK